MAVWSARCSGYKIGFVLLLFASGLYFIGFVTPYWTSISQSGLGSSASRFEGLWMGCYSISSFGVSQTSCSAISSDAPGWFKAVQALQSIALIGVIVSCIYAFVHNCCQSAPAHSRFLEIIAGGSGVVGFIGAMVYVGKLVEANSKSGDYLSWAFGLDLTGCILLVLSAVLLFATNKPFTAQANSGVVMYSGAAVQGQAYPGAYPGGYPGGYPGAAQPGYVVQQPGMAPQQYPPAANYPPPAAGYSAQAQPVPPK